MRSVEERLEAVMTAPLDELIATPRYQSGSEPMLVPKVAGQRERRLIDPRSRLYDVGRWGAHDLTPKLGVDAAIGRVLAIRSAPRTAADLHPDLRAHYRDLYQPAVMFINSSVVRLVEISWRWHAAIALFTSLYESPISCVDEDRRLRARVEDCERIVLSGIARIDPALPADDPQTLWGEVVTDSG